MYSLNRIGAFGPQQGRQFSTGPEHKPCFNNMPSSTGFLNKVSFDFQKISTEKKFVNPNFVNKTRTNIWSCPNNAPLLPCSQVKDIPPEFTMKPKSSSVPPIISSLIPFNTDQVEKKEDTQRKKERKPHKKTRDHCSSPRKAHKNKINMGLRFEIDEVGVDALSDDFESDTNDATPMIGIKVPPVFIHEALPEFEIHNVPSSPMRIKFERAERLPAVLLSVDTNARRRVPSECGSEDSFIVFQCSNDDNDSDFECDMDSDDEDDDDLDTSFSVEEELQCEKTEKGNSKDPSKKSKKVTFANDLCKVHPIIAWSYAYQAARKGPWEEHARDRCRFKDRISKVENIIGPILKIDHRQKIYKERMDEFINHP